VDSLLEIYRRYSDEANAWAIVVAVIAVAAIVVAIS
jgi:hypothetical protein